MNDECNEMEIKFCFIVYLFHFENQRSNVINSYHIINK